MHFSNHSKQWVEVSKYMKAKSSLEMVDLYLMVWIKVRQLRTSPMLVGQQVVWVGMPSYRTVLGPNQHENKNRGKGEMEKKREGRGRKMKERKEGPTKMSKGRKSPQRAAKASGALPSATRKE